MSENILRVMRELFGDELIDKRLAEWAEKIKRAWLSYSDGERLTLMALCCRGCGTTNLPCHCENDE